MIFGSKTAFRAISAAAACMPMLAASLSASLSASVQAGDLEASAGVASTYLFRGVDVNDGRPQVFGDLTYRADFGMYLSGWGSSAGNGANEFDAVLGFSHDIGPVSVNIGAINYVYPGDDDSDTFGAESEAFIGTSWNGFELYYYQNIASKREQNEGYYYVAASYTWKQFAVTLGHAADNSISGKDNVSNSAVLDSGTVVVDTAKYSYTHLDITYAYNDNLSFTLSQIVDRDVEVTPVSGEHFNVGGRDIGKFGGQVGDMFGAVDDDSLLFVMTYSLPLEF